MKRLRPFLTLVLSLTCFAVCAQDKPTPSLPDVFTTKDGRTFRNFRVVGSDGSSISIMDDYGVTRIDLTNLPPEFLQGSDPVKVLTAQKEDYEKQIKQLQAKVEDLKKQIREETTRQALSQVSSVFSLSTPGSKGSPNEPIEASNSTPKTDIGAYITKVKRAIGAIWYPKVQNQMQLISVGVVHVRVTIHSNGSVDVSPILAGDKTEDNNEATLRSISVNSIKEAAPFDPFPESVRKKYGDS